ncbi:hypothetical protein PVAND_015415 [Polypedilum vanderplanki]|uniref:GPI ethanolamine phosphate transferase 2 C-terminal domain-containing protein n=1 Tax=Polypedilum vanderplanki TaxID=319348 RepID=A0A9J6BD19_POLVA|nr:hypothetical protein PVAND_015415 [Polypedilum vanderplanki]
MTIKSENFYLVLLTASVISSFFFCIGFFPYSNVKKLKSELSNNELEKLNLPKINRSILMLIDALRLDLISDRNNFPFVHEVLNKGDGCMLQMKVNLPTVTKPRITAMTSGTVPSFLDVAKNFAKNKIKIDTFLHQMNARNQKIVFAGDDTWLMFPFFTRHYANRDSLFVNDFYEGDLNITRSLAYELKQNDWKLLILHYLGLDHIGHVFNPFHELIQPKLQEMDQVIKTIVEKLSEWNSKSKEKSILILTSDHGMRNAGGHSGSSIAETHIPLLILGHNCTSNDKEFYNQIDLATTFSIMNGLQIPESSIGAVIPELLFNMEPIKQLNVVKIINERLLKMIEHDKSEEFVLKHKKASSYFEIYTKDTKNKNAFETSFKLFMESSKEISEILAQQSLDVNLFYVLLGLFMNIFIAITIILPSDLFKVKDLKIDYKKFIPVIAVLIALKFLIFNEIFNQTNDLKSFIVVIIMGILLRLVGDIFILKLDRYKLHLFDNDILYLLLIGHIFFTISVASSSFIEEEHQIWYYLCNAMFILLTFYEFRGRKSLESFMNVIAQCIPVLLIHIFIRRMNQTGDKWINVPDIGDWLHKNENEDWLNLLIVVSIFLSLSWLAVKHVHGIVLLPFVILAHVALYLHHTRSLVTERIDISNTTLFWISIALIISITVIQRLQQKMQNSNFFLIFVLISMLLHQPQNIGLCFCIGITSMLINHAVHRMIKNTHEKIIAKIFMHWWIGKMFYFYQGNSNSLSTIDTNAGFVGQSHVHLPIIFIFSTINTFNGQIMSIILLVISLIEDSKRLMLDSKTVTLLLTKWISFLTIIPSTSFLVIITLLRHHLFIWSVFSPKLLYDFCTNFLVLIAMLIVKFMIKY